MVSGTILVLCQYSIARFVVSGHESMLFSVRAYSHWQLTHEARADTHGIPGNALEMMRAYVLTGLDL